ncbi:MAG: ATP-dependent DNA helicase [Thermoplasmatota archaeon]
MADFCERCGSLLLWNFSGGRRVKRCPRCGFVDEPLPGMEKKEKKTEYSVRKGVSPRSSDYARRSIRTAVLNDDYDEDDDLDCEGGEDSGIRVPDGAMFPFDTVRPGQDEFMKDVGEALERGKFLLASVPTGIGKTAASLSPAVEYALNNGLFVFFLTSKQSQHQIAVKTLRRVSQRSGKKIRVVDVISKQSMCPRDISSMPHYTFNFICRQQSRDGKCPYYRTPPGPLLHSIRNEILDVYELKDLSVSRRICPHRAALESAKEADVIICDFNYLFSELSDPILKGLEKRLQDIVIIVDEAHNLPDRIRANQSRELHMKILQEAEFEMGGNRVLRRKLKEMREFIIHEAGKRMGDEEEVLLDKREFISSIMALFSSTLDENFDIHASIEMLEDESRKRGKGEGEDPVIFVTQFMKGLLGLTESHILYIALNKNKGLESLKLIYRNLDPGEISGPIFKSCRCAILMSGTLTPPSMFGDVLGMARERRMERSYSSPFPRKNRLTLIDHSVTTAYTRRSPAMYRRISGNVSEIARAVPGNVAAFFPSYFMMNEIKDHLRVGNKSIIVEGKEMSRRQKAEILEDLRRKKWGSGGLLLAVMGGSLSEGVDYRDNLLSGVIVVGLPLAPPSLEVTSLRDLYRKKWGRIKGDDYSYYYPAVNRIVQAAGRSIRSETDRSVIVLMEERLGHPRYLKFLPEDLKPRSMDRNSIKTAISSFFR